MIQGTTLKAGLADCGGISEAVGGSEAMTAYVILSRLMSADGLLILRAFSPELFAMGNAPGPFCLLKYLRHYFGRLPGNYTVEDARKEYEDLIKKQENQRLKRKTQGPSWPCWSCGNNFPAEGFGTKAVKSEEETFNLCVAPGHWRCCTACQQVFAQQAASEDKETQRAEQICSICLTSRSLGFFEEGALECNPCILLTSFDFMLCNKCDKYKKGTEVFKVSADSNEYHCYQCAPELCMIECTVCSKTRPSTDFRGHPRRVRNQTIRRCAHCRICYMF